MNKYKITLEYDGTLFSGWQVQENAVTAQGFIENRLHKITKEKVRVHGAGRIDAGVHAKNFVAHFTTNLDLCEESFKKALNQGQRSDIWIKRVEKVHPGFHARYDAKSRKYLYCIINTNKKLVFHGGYFWKVAYPLEICKMQEAVEYLVGTHDFSAFRASSCSAKNPVRKIISIKIKSKGNRIFIGVHGTSFLQYMVRNIVGTLVEVGRGRFSPDTVKELLKNGDRSQAGPTAAPHGLFFMNVLY